MGSPNFQLIANLVVNPNIPFPYSEASIAQTVSSGSSSSSTTTDSTSLGVAIAALVIAFLTMIVVIVLAVMKPQQIVKPSLKFPTSAPVEPGEHYNKLVD